LAGSLDTFAALEVVADIAGGTGTIAVEGLAQGISLGTDSVRRIGSSSALCASSIHPLGAEDVSWLLSVGNAAITILEEVTIVAAQAVPVSGIEGLALGVGRFTDTVGEIRSSRALQASGSFPLGTEDIARLSIVRN
jgi:hypothetical protein